jgi:hypothetical protein
MLHDVFDHLFHPHLSDEDRDIALAALGLIFSLFLAALLFDVFIHLHDYGA